MANPPEKRATRPRALPAQPPSPGDGRHPDPRGGRIFTISVKISAPEAEALSKEKRRMEKNLRAKTGTEKKMSDSAFYRARLLNGGDALKVRYPAVSPDTRRAKRGSVPKPVPPAPATPAKK